MTSSEETPARYYESVVILHPDTPESDQKDFFKRSAETIKKYKGNLNHLDTWGKRRLGNPIKKMKLGIYFHATFESDAECVGELERLYRIDERVLRFLHTRLDERKSLTQYVDDYKNTLVESNRREQEKDAKRDARRSAHSDGGFRGPQRRHSSDDSDGESEE